MEAKEQSFKSIMQGEHKLKIPFFNVLMSGANITGREFFLDMKESFETQKEHFLGSVILKRSQGNENYSNVIDGQQRLTTFSILIKCLYDMLEDSKKKHFESCLFEDYTDDYLPKIHHSYLDREKFKQIIQGDVDTTAK